MKGFVELLAKDDKMVQLNINHIVSVKNMEGNYNDNGVPTHIQTLSGFIQGGNFLINEPYDKVIKKIEKVINNGKDN